jgi:hypothetical protein
VTVPEGTPDPEVTVAVSVADARAPAITVVNVVVVGTFTWQPPVENRFLAAFGSAIKRGSGREELAAAPDPAENVGGAGASDPFTVADPNVLPTCTQTAKSKFSTPLTLVARTSQTAVATPFCTES